MLYTVFPDNLEGNLNRLSHWPPHPAPDAELAEDARIIREAVEGYVRYLPAFDDDADVWLEDVPAVLHALEILDAHWGGADERHPYEVYAFGRFVNDHVTEMVINAIQIDRDETT